MVSVVWTDHWKVQNSPTLWRMKPVVNWPMLSTKIAQSSANDTSGVNRPLCSTKVAFSMVNEASVWTGHWGVLLVRPCTKYNVHDHKSGSYYMYSMYVAYVHARLHIVATGNVEILSTFIALHQYLTQIEILNKPTGISLFTYSSADLEWNTQCAYPCLSGTLHTHDCKRQRLMGHMILGTSPDMMYDPIIVRYGGYVRYWQGAAGCPDLCMYVCGGGGGRWWREPPHRPLTDSLLILW